MLSFFRKHRCCTVSFCILFSISAYFYLTYVRYEPDRYDHRHYPIPPLTETWSTTIEYKALPYVKFNKCLLISFNEEKLVENLKERVGEKYYNEVYMYEYNSKYSLFHTEKISKQHFYQEAKTKPTLRMRIYKNGALIEEQNLYFSNFEGVEKINVNGKETIMSQIIGRPGYRKGKCYSFEGNSSYYLELINDTVIPEYHDVEVFFTIRPILRKP